MIRYRIDYSQAMAKVSRIRGLSSKIGSEGRTTLSIDGQEVGLWSGAASLQFTMRCGILKAEIGNRTTRLSNAAEAIAQAAAQIRREDEQASY